MRVDRETAQAEFDRFIELNNIVLEDEEDEEDEDRKKTKESRQKMINSVVTAIQKDKVAVNDDGTVTISVITDRGESKQLTFKKITGSVLAATDNKKEGQTMGRAFAMMAAATGTPASTFHRMYAPDINLCSSVFSFFLSVAD